MTLWFTSCRQKLKKNITQGGELPSSVWFESPYQISFNSGLKDSEFRQHKHQMLALKRNIW